mgnify:CR=1 FL=1
MSTEIKVPTLGESVTEATIGQWFKKAGDRVEQDETIAELETDKVTVEVPAPSAGILQEIVVQEGETVAVGALIGVIGEGDGAGAAAPARASSKPAETIEKAPKEGAEDGSDTTLPNPSHGDAMPAAPSAQKMMADKGIAAADVQGSGKRGQVLKGDVLDALAKGSSAPVAAAPVAARAPSGEADAAREERVKMTRLRATIACPTQFAQRIARHQAVAMDPQETFAEFLFQRFQRLLDQVDLLPLTVLDDGQFQCRVVVHITNQHGNRR